MRWWPARYRPAQRSRRGNRFRIGILSPAERTSTRIFDGFREGSRERGYIEGRNITIEYRLAAGDTSRLPEMARELIRLPVDVIVTGGQKSAVLAHEATHTISIVMGIVRDPPSSSPAPTRSSNE